MQEDAVNDALKDAEEASFEVADTEEPVPPQEIVAYNELRSCADLYRMYFHGKLEIQPDFQRDVVWKGDDQTRFIDSLVKQLPIPSMCFSLDHGTQKWKVIDGLQRMSSIIRFLSDDEWKLSDLRDISPQLANVTNKSLREGDSAQRRLYSIVEDVSIPVTVIRCDYSKESHMRYLFTIFHRLNSAGVRLTNQEIRNCIYTGPFNDFLKAFDQTNDEWKQVRRKVWGSMSRFRSVEVLLRVLAFSHNLQKYEGNLAGFLNEYMHRHSRSDDAFIESCRCALDRACTEAWKAISQSDRKLPLAVVEAILVALVNRVDAAPLTLEDAKQKFDRMLELPSFSAAPRYAVSSAENVRARIADAKACFG